jgi:hypothetical protein
LPPACCSRSHALRSAQPLNCRDVGPATPEEVNQLHFERDTSRDDRFEPVEHLAERRDGRLVGKPDLPEALRLGKFEGSFLLQLSDS